MPTRSLSAALHSRMFSRSPQPASALDQPGGPLEAKLDVLGPGRQDVHVVVGVIADRVPGRGDLLQPIDVLLLADAADAKACSTPPWLFTRRQASTV